MKANICDRCGYVFTSDPKRVEIGRANRRHGGFYFGSVSSEVCDECEKDIIRVLRRNPKRAETA